MRLSVLALLAGSAACSSYSTTNVIAPDDDGFAGSTSLTSEASEQGGASVAISSKATATTAAQLATGGTVSAGGATVVVTGGASTASIGYGGSSAATVIASGGYSTGGASTVANECSAIYAPCGAERTCTNFSRVQYGTCFYGSFFCGKYIVWYYEGGPVSACNHTEKGCSPEAEFERYYQDNCSPGTGGSSSTGGAVATGGTASVAAQYGGAQATGGSTAKSTSVADCSVKSNEMPCRYHNDPADPSKCIGEPLPNVTKCTSYLTAACNGAYGGQGCWHACSECSLWGSQSPECGKALESIPRDIQSCSKLYPESS